jgi:acyl-CoA thioester hydrolase|tara:strand:- start:2659 stop:3114 length:456 start_codon:yes stop_codon:yes gene_type:complete
MVYKWDYPAPYVTPITVIADNIDALGHTNNGVYIDWCQQAAWRHSSSLGLGAAHYSELKRAMAIHEASYKYLAPCFVDEEVLVATWLTACDGRLTMERSFQILQARSGGCLFRGKWQLVCINLTSNKPSRMPKEFKEIYVPHVTPKTGQTP